jgi:hypothetical protein
MKNVLCRTATDAGAFGSDRTVTATGASPFIGSATLDASASTGRRAGPGEGDAAICSSTQNVEVSLPTPIGFALAA